MPRVQFGQIVADVIEIDFGFLRDVMLIQLERFEEQDGLALHQGRAGIACDLRHLAAMGRVDEMLHLHGLEHGNLLPRAHEFAFADVDGDDGALQRRRHRDRALRAGHIGRRFCRLQFAIHLEQQWLVGFLRGRDQ